MANKKRTPRSTPFQTVWEIVRRVPKKKVTTYGQISSMLDGKLSALAVSWAMFAARTNHRDRVPWQRVVNADGSLPEKERAAQRKLLELDGVAFDKEGCIDLDRFGWKPR